MSLVRGILIAAALAALWITTACAIHATCGDGYCDPEESCDQCSLDCGACNPTPECGDGVCEAEAGEDCEGCPTDCGYCAARPVCGDGACEDYESCETCATDCPCPPETEPETEPADPCGDGVCEEGECETCPDDCTAEECPPPDPCGDEVCEEGECETCPDDCTAEECGCGDGVCGEGECETCAEDCLAQQDACGGEESCGDGFCDSGECGSCPSDCTDGECPAAGTCDVEGHGGLGDHGDPCSTAPEQWRCVRSAEWGTAVSQVCRWGIWQTFNVEPRDCDACCGDFSEACLAL